MIRILTLPLLALGLSACVTTPTPEAPPPPVVANDPGSNACGAVARAQGMEVLGTEGPSFATDASGSVSGAAYGLRVSQGGQATTVQCVYSYDNGTAQISGV